MKSNGWKLLAFSLILCGIGIPQGLADVVPISISQQVSVSGSVTVCDFGCEGAFNIQHNGNGFSSAKTNTQLPPTDLSENGNTSDSLQLQEENSPRTASVFASAGEFFTLTPNHLSLDVSASGELSGNTTLMAGTVSAGSQYVLVFDLTSQALVHLAGGISGGGITELPAFGDGSLNGQIHLSGPGFQFDQAPSLPSESTFDEFFTLGPGQYTLEVDSAVNREQDYDINSSSSVALSLNADFTSAVPEPFRVSMVLGVLIMVGLFFGRRPAQ